jgi:hypothetical protein
MLCIRQYIFQLNFSLKIHGAPSRLCFIIFNITKKCEKIIFEKTCDLIIPILPIRNTFTSDNYLAAMLEMHAKTLVCLHVEYELLLSYFHQKRNVVTNFGKSQKLVFL